MESNKKLKDNYTEGISGGGIVILNNGIPVYVSEIIKKLNSIKTLKLKIKKLNP